MKRPKPKRYDESDCFLCATPLGGDVTREHVVPEQLYEKPIPYDNLFTLPAHRRCNQHTSSHENVFFDFVALQVEKPELSARFWRGLQRPQALGKKIALYKNINVTPTGSVVDIDQGRVNWVLAKMVKGFFARETGTLLGNAELRWSAFQVVDVDTIPFETLPRVVSAHDVVSARWVQSADEPFFTHWVVNVYETCFFSISTLPAHRALRVRDQGARPMTWPRR